MSYFLYINSCVRGPYSESELRDMLAHREIQPEVLASTGNDSEWVSLDVSLGLTSQRAPEKSSAFLNIPRQTLIADRGSDMIRSPESNMRRLDKALYPSAQEDNVGAEKRSALWQVAAALVIAYALFIVLAATFYRWWNGDWDNPKAIIRLAGRSIVCFSVAQGLIQSKSWAYWIAICFSCLLTLIGLMGLSVLMEVGDFFKRPYPYVDLGVYLLTVGITFALFIVLVILPFRERR